MCHDVCRKASVFWMQTTLKRSPRRPNARPPVCTPELPLCPREVLPLMGEDVAPEHIDALFAEADEDGSGRHLPSVCCVVRAVSCALRLERTGSSQPVVAAA